MNQLPTRPVRSLLTDHVAGFLRPIAVLVINAVDALTRPDRRDLHKLPRTGGVLLVANHISHADPLLLGVSVIRAGRWPQFLAKASLFQTPVLGRIFAAIGQIPVERRHPDAGSALLLAEQELARGGCVLIYPEGTISTDPELWPMSAKTGAARLALRSGCPVIPVGQWGAHDILYGTKLGLPRLLPRRTISVLIGDPVELGDLRAGEPGPDCYQEATRRIIDAITGLVVELRRPQ